MFAITFKDSTTGFLAGQSGKIMITTDSGDSWLSQISGTINSIYDIKFIGDNSLIAVGENGTILITTNMGTNWNLRSSGTIQQLSGVSFSDRNNGTIVGYSGTILRTTNGGVSFVEEERIDALPTEFLLSQNYPNPFNPSTKIKYSIPDVIANGVKQSQFVTIKVFDILGIEIETLVNEEKPTGAYEVTWHASDLPSGVYFYQLLAGSYFKTKKMLLIK
jgi:hypothetical protein